tara:strand:+ start:2813 stop:2917 length:105 start_codon:yes stop_codon:yes gene_type:complete
MFLCPISNAQLKEVESLEKTDRGSGGLVLQEKNN